MSEIISFFFINMTKYKNKYNLKTIYTLIYAIIDLIY